MRSLIRCSNNVYNLELHLTLGYHWLGLLKHALANTGGGRQIEITYEQDVNIRVYLKPGICESLCKQLTEATAAQVVIERGTDSYI